MYSPWHAMPRAWDKPEELRARQNEIEYLRHEKEQKSFREMRLNAHDGECHASKVAESIAWESTGRVPVGCGVQRVPRRLA
jgi:hypothetical protein